jgi:hypothetical protein
VVQKVCRAFKIVSPDLNPDGGVRRTKEQKKLEQLVIVSSCLKTLVFQFGFKQLAVAWILERRNIAPWSRSVWKDRGQIIARSKSFRTCFVFVLVLHKLLTCSTFQTARGWDLFPNTKAIYGTNFRKSLEPISEKQDTFRE